MNIIMRVLIILFFASCISAKINMKALTESMGQEVIEVGAPIRELPPDIEEEPSAENDGETTTAEVKVVTPKEKPSRKSDPTKKTKDVDKLDGKKQEDEEARIEKELADIYKDSIDYKSDSAEVTQENATEVAEKPVARVRTNFQFQPDSNSPEDIARFRTSVDDINCDRSKLSGQVKPDSQGGETIERRKRIEKTLAEDKNSYVYTSDNAKVLKINKKNDAGNNVARSKNNKGTTSGGFWFGPDSTHPKQLDKFRTSQDYNMKCELLKLSEKISDTTSGSQVSSNNKAYWAINFILFILN